ncbi:glutamine ABC transporter substrate-binding protein [Collibacillus ludicampi]|uniref:Glutamine ABC transporter substrate-binding protein n=1 Tax=Collibacillus ludicampi TaxID=2771369 RepID=A0AAV4LF59_9BACL|nr:glutamate ABC transporter substrate-binding protein [Collibacillus ludicampi]GIM46461.1 glutamine ABC transporter substrate-binding protein [Collibacillus ludicampi]
MNKWKKIVGVGIASILLTVGALGCSTASKETSSSGDNKAETTGGTLKAIKDRGKLIAGVKYDTNLFGLKDPADNQVKGFDVDIAKAIAKDILGDENKIDLKEVTSKTRIPMLKNGDIDIIVATMTITEERKKEVDFSNVYFKAGQSLLVKKDSPITGIQDLDGKTVIVVKGSTSATNIKKKAPKAKVTEYENYAEAFTALKAGKGDALSTDNAILLGMQKQDPNFKLVGGLFTDEPYGIAVRKGDKEMLDEVNKVIKNLQDSGEYDKIYEKWFGEKPQK